MSASAPTRPRRGPGLARHAAAPARPPVHRLAAAAVLVGWLPCWLSAAALPEVIRDIQPKVVKIWGAGGLRGLEAYQSGFLITADGHILTAFSYVLDTDDIGVTLNDGRKFSAQLVGTDPRLELAMLKIEAAELPHFVIADSVALEPGDRILALSNLYGIATGNEAASVLHGSVAARTQLSGRRGAYATPYQGAIYVLDAVTNNAGAAGGVLTDRQGRLAGVLGKELRSAETNLWLNYALPMDTIQDSIQAMLQGGPSPAGGDPEGETLAETPWTLRQMGVAMVPELLPQTPPFVEWVRPDSPAHAADIRADDLLVYVDQTAVRSVRDVRDALRRVEREDLLRVTVLRRQSLISTQMLLGDERREP